MQAIFVGTRRTDPHGGRLTWFDRTDHGWPAFVRVHPVIEWRYVEIWAVSTSCSHPFSNSGGCGESYEGRGKGLGGNGIASVGAKGIIG